MRAGLALALAFFWGGAALACGDSVPRTALVSAFAPEGEKLEALVESPASCQINGRRFVTGEIEGKKVVVFMSGVSMVNAAMTTQLALDHFHVKRLVFSGIAGDADPDLSIGDVAVPEQWGEYLEATFARETPDGYRPVPFLTPPHFPNFGMIFPNGVSLSTPKGETSRFWFEADKSLVAVAREAALSTTLNRCEASGGCLSRAPRVRVGGSGISAGIFVDNAAFRDYARRTFGAEVMDMETAALAHVALANDVPFIAFRSVSDLAGGGEGANQMKTFMNLAAANSAAFTRQFLRLVPD